MNITAVPDPTWRDDAACAGQPNFTDQPIGYQRRHCLECPVRAACLLYELDLPLDWRDRQLMYGGVGPMPRNKALSQHHSDATMALLELTNTWPAWQRSAGITWHIDTKASAA